MAEDLDVEAMLEAPYKKDEEVNGKIKENGDSRRHRNSDKKRRSSSRNRRSRSRTPRDKRRSGDKDRRRSKSRDRNRAARDLRRSRSKDRRSKSKDRRSRSKDKRSRSRDRKEKDRRNRRSRSRERKRSVSKKRSPSPVPIKPPFGRRPRSPLGLRSNSPVEELSPEERDARTVFVMQLSQRIRARDLEEFFSSVGKVRDVRLIVCNKTRRFKGIAYIEFKDPESVALVRTNSGVSRVTLAQLQLHYNYFFL
jgi:RNA-binding protein 39